MTKQDLPEEEILASDENKDQILSLNTTGKYKK